MLVDELSQEGLFLGVDGLFGVAVEDGSEAGEDFRPGGHL